MEDFRSSRNTFHLIPSFEDCIKPYKRSAREMSKDKHPKLTDRQHHIAKMYGFDDWQAFQYRLRSLHDELSRIDLTADEWGYIFDTINGWAVTINEAADGIFPSVADGDIYSGYGAKWFGVFSKIDDDERYEPSEPMMGLLKKIDAMTAEQRTAVVFKGLTFWNRSFLAAPRKTLRG